VATLPVVDSTGASAGSVEASDAVFAADLQPNVVHETIVAINAAKRQGTHKSKIRSEVRGGGAKPFRQKGTGRARQGSSREPHMTGGGDVHGPVPRKYTKDVPVRVKRQALCCALSERVRGETLKVLDTFSLEAPKSKTVAEMAKAVTGDARKTLLIAAANEPVLHLSTRNIWNVTLTTASDVNAQDVLYATAVVLLPGAKEALEARLERVKKGAAA